MAGKESTALATAKAPELPEQVTRRGISDAQWRTLSNNLFPGANPNSVLMVWDYCIARRLDPMKKPCHIVPMEVKDAKTGNYAWRDVVMPGIYEHRTTAQRTGEYLGHSEPAYGGEVEQFGVLAPAWCSMVVYRWNAKAGQRAEFPVTLKFSEVCAVTKDRKTGDVKANSRWSKAPQQMLTKCTEAAGLREAFPEELGGEQTAEEMDGQRHIEAQIIETTKTVAPKPDDYDDWLDDIRAVADEGEEPFSKAWEASDIAKRTYLTETDPSAFEALKARSRGEGVIGH